MRGCSSLPALQQQLSRCKRQTRGHGHRLVWGQLEELCRSLREETLPAALGEVSLQCSPLLLRALLLGLLTARMTQDRGRSSDGSGKGTESCCSNSQGTTPAPRPTSLLTPDLTETLSRSAGTSRRGGTLRPHISSEGHAVTIHCSLTSQSIAWRRRQPPVGDIPVAHPHLGSCLAPDSEASRNARVPSMPPNFCLVWETGVLFCLGNWCFPAVQGPWLCLPRAPSRSPWLRHVSSSTYSRSVCSITLGSDFVAEPHSPSSPPHAPAPQKYCLMTTATGRLSSVQKAHLSTSSESST